jgi:hypothetical protein
MTDTSVIDLDSDFVCFWWSNLDFFDGQVLAGLPGYCGLVTRSDFVVSIGSVYVYLASDGLIQYFISFASCARFRYAHLSGSIRHFNRLDET